ncbi:MAG: hypothetical protein AB1711_01525 [Thermodesulfobacteriota bacterium]
MMKQDFKSDFFELMKMIMESDSMALSRYADGEANVLKNNTIGNKDGWLYKQDKNLIFRADLRKALLCSDPGFFYGISCTCCDKVNHDYLLAQIRTGRENLTFSNIWVNANCPLFQEHFFKTLIASKKDIVICTNSKAKIKKLEELIPIKDFIPIPGNCVVFWEKNRDYVKALLDLKGSTYKNTIFLFAAGPLSEILIYELWLVNPNNILLDIGSSLDPFLFNRKSRSYHYENSEFANRTCVW